MNDDILKNGIDKVTRYNWKIRDEPGTLLNIDKNLLIINPEYQREANLTKVLEFASNWSWISAGVIIVANRDNVLWVIDGQHRVLAARKRVDIHKMPCVVFNTSSLKDEAMAFKDVNCNRKPVSSLAKYHALIAAEDESALKVKSVLDGLGITPKSTATKAKEIKSVALLMTRCSDNFNRFCVVMSLCSEMCDDMPIQEKLIDGLWYIDSYVENGLLDARLVKRIKSIGARRLVDSATKASAFFAKGGAKVWAAGMIEEINKGLQNKFKLKE